MEKSIKTYHWYPASAAPEHIPVLDLSSIVSGGEDRQRLQGAVNASGFFYLKNFGVGVGEIDELIDVSQDFFSRSDDEKEKMIYGNLPPRGFTPLKHENLSRLLGTDDGPDLCMKYSWIAKENVYPNEGFSSIWNNYYEKMGNIAVSLLTVISEMLKDQTLCDEQDWRYIINGDNMLRHLYYPDLEEEQALKMAAHTDLGSITMLYQTPAPNGHVALEVELEEKFVPVPAIEGTLVVNFGDLLAHLTGGRVRATKHRVVHSNKPGGERTSTICFCAPDRRLGLRKFEGSEFSGLLTEGVDTFGDLIDQNSRKYLGKKD